MGEVASVYGVPFGSKLTIQSMYILQVDVQFHGDDPVKQSLVLRRRISTEATNCSWSDELHGWSDEFHCGDKFQLWRRIAAEATNFNYMWRRIAAEATNFNWHPHFRNRLQWKALKCHTLGAAVHVIVLVCWLESINASWLSHACHAHSVLFLPTGVCKVRSRRSFTGLVQLIHSFPSWFYSFLSQITLCFLFGSKDMITAFTCLPSYRHSSFTLRAYHCWRHTYCQWPIIELAINVSPPLAMWSRFICRHVFHGVIKKNGWLIM